MKKKTILVWLLTFSLAFAGCSGLSVSNGPTPTPTTAPKKTTTAPLKPPTSAPTSAPAQCSTHTDADNNGICDVCSADVLAVIDLFALNDVHGKFTDSDVQPGVDEMTTWLKEQKSTLDNTILLSSGDMWQGSSESNLTKGKILTEWMNDLDFVSMTFGNHEYDWGREYIEINEELAEFPFLALNIYERSTNTLASYCTPSIIVEKEGVKIGIIGAIGNCYSSISSNQVSDVYFKVGKDLTELVKKESEKLRAEGCEIIVYSIHDGYDKTVSGQGTITDDQLKSYYDVSLSNGYVDVVFEGHTHKAYVLKDSYGIWHLQDGGDNRTGISHVTIEYNKANDTVVTTNAEIVSHDKYKTSYRGDAIVDTLMSKYASEIGDVNAVIAQNPKRLTGDQLRQLVADLYCDAGIERWGDKYDIALGGGYISVRSPRVLDAGDVTYADLQMLFPFDNQLVLCSIKGVDLNNNFFETTNDNYFITLGDYGDRVRKKLDPNATY